jgi:hypothetical protein
MVVKLTEALSHLRLSSDYPAAQVLPYLLAAESAAQAFCQRKFFAEQEDLVTARAAIPGMVREATAAFDAAVLVAKEIEDLSEQNAALAVACRIREEALGEYEQTLWGIVITDDIKAAILLTLDHLYENRSENVIGSIVSELKTGVQSLLWPYRVRVGV